METIIGRDGIEVHLEGRGEQTLVMIHGWPDTYRLWDSQVAEFKSRYRCARFSLPGFERGQPRRLLEMEQMLAALEEAIDLASPHQPVILMLHDWGCFFGYQYAMRHPDRVSRIVAVDVGDAGSKDHQLSLSAKAMTATYQLYLALAWKLGGMLGNAMTRGLARLMGAPAASGDIHCGMNYPYYWLWRGMLKKRPLGIRPVKLTHPLLFLYGSKKPVSFHSQAWLDTLNRTPGSGAVALETGHWVMVEKPLRFNGEVRRWLADNDVKHVA